MTGVNPVQEEKMVRKKFVPPTLRMEADLTGLTHGIVECISGFDPTGKPC